MTRSLRTNRDLYLAIADLSKEYQGRDRTLEVYLLAVLSRSREFHGRESLTLNEFYELIASGFTEAPAPFNEDWREEYDLLPDEEESYRGWQATIIKQIVDLREMEECGTLKNEMRYFGVYSPRKSYWYNFDPQGYLECAMAGSFGGWKPDEDSDREYVPGPVAVFAEDGSIQSINPEDLPNPTFEMPFVTWEHFRDFVMSGQLYE